MSSKKYSAEKQKQSQQSPDYPEKYWNKPPGRIIIGVIIGVIVLFIGYISSHLLPRRENKNRIEIPRSLYSGTIKVPTPGIYMKDVRADNNGGVGIRIIGPNQNVVLDNTQTSGNRKGGIEINNPQSTPPQKSK